MLHTWEWRGVLAAPQRPLTASRTSLSGFAVRHGTTSGTLDAACSNLRYSGSSPRPPARALSAALAEAKQIFSSRCLQPACCSRSLGQAGTLSASGRPWSISALPLVTNSLTGYLRKRVHDGKRCDRKCSLLIEVQSWRSCTDCIRRPAGSSLSKSAQK